MPRGLYQRDPNKMPRVAGKKCKHDNYSNKHCAYCMLEVLNEDLVSGLQFQILRSFKVPTDEIRAYPFKWQVFAEAELKQRRIRNSRAMPKIVKNPFAHLP